MHFDTPPPLIMLLSIRATILIPVLGWATILLQAGILSYFIAVLVMC